MAELKIGVVGPCAAGKTTLIRSLRAAGWNARHIAQEHSYVKDMWQRLTHPDLLIYLDVSFATSVQRRKLDWTQAEYQVQIDRLEHARRHANLVLQTDGLTPAEILEKVLETIDGLSKTA